jgi:transcriptional regulator with XRE-family HTH domain
MSGTPDPQFGSRMQSLREERGLSLRQLGKLVFYSHSHLWDVESGKKPATAELARRVDDALAADGILARLVPGTEAVPGQQSRTAGREPWETADLLARLRASDSSPGTIEAMHAAAFELCCQYSWRDARGLRAEGHGWLREVLRLVRLPIGLDAHRELLVVSGWLALLVGCVEYDMGMRGAAEATRVAAGGLGKEAGHGEIMAWAHEMSAWFALTQGRYRNVIAAAEAGQAAIGEHTAAVQLIGQEAKARARMGDVHGVRDALDRGHHLLGKFLPPERPDHHFVVDPDKWDFYAMDAYRLAGENELAKYHAEQVLTLGASPDGTEKAPMRMAEARLTLGAVAARATELDQAVEVGLSAFRADRRCLPTLLMVGAELDGELHRRYPGEQAAKEFHEALHAVAHGADTVR